VAQFTEIVDLSVTLAVGHSYQLVEVLVLERFAVRLQSGLEMLGVDQSSTVLVKEPQRVLKLLLHLRLAFQSDTSDQPHELVQIQASGICITFL